MNPDNKYSLFLVIFCIILALLCSGCLEPSKPKLLEMPNGDLVCQHNIIECYNKKRPCIEFTQEPRGVGVVQKTRVIYSHVYCFEHHVTAIKPCGHLNAFLSNWAVNKHNTNMPAKTVGLNHILWR